ncbi:MAG: right-handed parallel beta-helix repeat-containing protein, partial [Planctomycetes bacterium]|nr:right-handed parallel beta-helix repeat-containing protein [Planctomycetota bacterium]
CDPDCNTNDIPDACDIADGTSDDCDGNLIPDECSPDCNNNGVADSCDVANGDAADCNRNGVPDECETSTALLVDDDAPNGGDGLTWQTAFNNLKDARSRALTCDLVNEIRIAEGTYTPGLNRQDSFRLLSGVRVSGGYAGLGAPDRNARDIALYETILTGNIGDPDDPTDNCYRVVAAYSVDETATLDGVTITGGYANGSTPLDKGAGLYIWASSPTITNCTVRENFGDVGAGMYVKGGSPTINHSTFVENEAMYFGGGIYLEDTSPSINDCTFDNNTAGLGGAMFNDASSPSVTTCTFFENTASSGAGIYNDVESAPAVFGTTFEGNTGSAGAAMYNIGSPTVMASSFCRNHATYGGAIYNRQNTALIENCQFTRNKADGGPIVEGDGGAIFNSSSSPVIRQCGFNENTAVIAGGAVASAGQGTPTISECTFNENSALIGGAGLSDAGSIQIHRSSFRGNSAVATGGAWYNHLADATMTWCTFTANTAESGGAVLNDNSVAAITSSLFVGNSVTGHGGGIRNIASRATLTHCTFGHNVALSDGGAIDNTHPTSLSTATGCILWSNTPALGQISNQNSGSASVSYSCIQGGWPGLGNTAADPLFAQPGEWDDNNTPLDSSDDFWVDGNYRLMPGSPAINAGDPFYQPAPGETDLDAHPRVLCGRVDLGAYEFGIGDFDCNRSTDLADAAHWPMCMTGPADSSYDAGCEAFDFNFDGHVDLRDAARFVSSVTGP